MNVIEFKNIAFKEKYKFNIKDFEDNIKKNLE
jgi:hypothetical protein